MKGSGKVFRTMLVSLLWPAAVFLLFAYGCQKVEKPAVNGQGKLALVVMEGISAPDYHQPLHKWTATHMDKLKKGMVTTEKGETEKISVDSCMGCHNNPENFCNNCHNYVGVKKIMVKK